MKRQNMPILNFKILLKSFMLAVVVYVASFLVAALLLTDASRTLMLHSMTTTAIVRILILTILFYLIKIKNYTLKIVTKRMHESERLLKAVFDQSPVGIALVNKHEIINMNNMFEKIVGWSKEEMTNLRWFDITHKEDALKDMELFREFMSGSIDSYEMDKRYITPDGSYTWVHMIVAALPNEGNIFKEHLCIVIDINERKRMIESLRESERSKAVLLSHLPGLAYRCRNNRDWTMQFLSDGCEELTGYNPLQLLHNKQLSYNDIIAPEYRDNVWNIWNRMLDIKGQFRDEYEIITASGNRKWVMEIGQGLYDENNQVIALEGIVIAISDSKRRQIQIEYMNNHDFMTGLFNRKYFEETKEILDLEENLPISIIIADINGLRLINDSFGSVIGDKIIMDTADLLKKCVTNNDILARTGGDDFTIILPHTGQEKVKYIVGLIKKACESNNRNTEIMQKINLSIGFGIKKCADQNIDTIIVEAEDYMIKRKLLERNSYHNSILSTIMATLYTRSQETEEHAQRIAILSKMIGEQIGLSEKSLDDLQLFSMLHDIGKVGIDDRILNKPDRLDDDEWNIMKKHPELGYRIAMTNPELESIADYILSHHERWDGKGYPRGLQGEDIPLLSRILAVVDAYDAMTADRVYRKAIDAYQALDEIKRNIGSQFDPFIADVFLKSMLKPNIIA